MVRTLLLLTLLLGTTAIEGVASDEPVLVLSGATGVVTFVGPTCSEGDFYVPHDGSFERGIAWRTGGVNPPYEGAFGEAFEVGAGTVSCVALWLSQDGTNAGESTDIYVWSGGVTAAPGAVLGVVVGVVLGPIPVWPEIGQFEIETSVVVDGPATAGAWGDWPGARAGYAFGVDVDQVGRPWTYIAEGVGFPAGWQHPEIAFGTVASMGIGMRFQPEDPVPVDRSSWGRVKALFTPTL